MMVSLPPRLRAVVAVLPAALSAIADVGSGHGALSAHLAQLGIRVIATELTPGPLAELRRNLAAWNVDDRVEVRFGRGLAPLRPGEVDLAVIAGVGARTALEIAADAPAYGLHWLVLQCMQRDSLVEPWLAARGWMVRACAPALQAGRVYATRLVEVAG